MKMKNIKFVYRGFINQPSTLQPCHHLHGKYCIVLDPGLTSDSVVVCFTVGDIRSAQIPRLCVSRVKLSSAED